MSCVYPQLTSTYAFVAWLRVQSDSSSSPADCVSTVDMSCVYPRLTYAVRILNRGTAAAHSVEGLI